jgi:hypothetical protein
VRFGRYIQFRIDVRNGKDGRRVVQHIAQRRIEGIPVRSTHQVLTLSGLQRVMRTRSSHAERPHRRQGVQ